MLFVNFEQFTNAVEIANELNRSMQGRGPAAERLPWVGTVAHRLIETYSRDDYAKGLRLYLRFYR